MTKAAWQPRLRLMRDERHSMTRFPWAAAKRAAVVAARMAAEAVETLSVERAAADEIDANRREQHVLDDMARTRFVSRDRPAGRGRW